MVKDMFLNSTKLSNGGCDVNHVCAGQGSISLQSCRKSEETNKEQTAEKGMSLISRRQKEGFHGHFSFYLQSLLS